MSHCIAHSGIRAFGLEVFVHCTAQSKRNQRRNDFRLAYYGNLYTFELWKMNIVMPTNNRPRITGKKISNANKTSAAFHEICTAFKWIGHFGRLHEHRIDFSWCRCKRFECLWRLIDLIHFKYAAYFCANSSCACGRIRLQLKEKWTKTGKMEPMLFRQLGIVIEEIAYDFIGTFGWRAVDSTWATLGDSTWGSTVFQFNGVRLS